MSKRKVNVVHFAPKGDDSFFDTVRDRVSAYFDDNSISPYANTAMWTKTTLMLLLYLVPYSLIVTGSGNLLVFYACWFSMALGMIGLGTSVMHDAHHGTYSANKKVNRRVGHILEFIGGYSVTWKIQHNVLHHTYTNIAGLDDDIDSIKLLRFSPRQPRYWYHRYQYLYTWFFYSLMTLFWMTAKDFLQVVRYHQHDLLIKQRISVGQALLRLTAYKAFYYGYIMVLPIVLTDVAWYHVVAGFMMMHAVAGLFLSCIFQPAHVVESSDFSSPVATGGTGRMEQSWAIHEITNTADFAPANRALTWFIGGLNFQIEHHLFTGVCHVHYPKIAPIVEATIREFGLPYHVEPTFLGALGKHARMLKVLGRQ